MDQYTSNGHLNQAYLSDKFRGVSASFNSDFNFASTKKVSIDVWVNIIYTIGMYTPLDFIFYDGNNSVGWKIRISPDNIIFDFGGNLQTHAISPKLTGSTWYHVVITHDNGLNKAYLNDVEILPDVVINDTGMSLLNDIIWMKIEPSVLNWYIDELKIYDGII